MKVIINAETDIIPENTTPISGQGNYYTNLLAALGYPTETLPVAALLQRLYRLSGKWLVVSPIHWLATHNDALIVACGEDLRLTQEESDYYFLLLSEFWATENRKLHFHNNHTWLLQVDNSPACHAPSPYTLRSKSIMPALEKIDDTLYWQRVLTEIQMLLNSRRMPFAQSAYPVNGVWIWGEGDWDEKNNEISVVAFDESAQQLAACFTTPVPNESEPSDGLILVHDWPPLPMVLTKLNDYTRNAAWFWNNQAYQYVPKTWWSRFIRTLK